MPCSSAVTDASCYAVGLRGHLTAMGLNCEGVVAGLGISGIYDLAPIAHTYLNQALRLSGAEIEQLSLMPACNPQAVCDSLWNGRTSQLQAQSQAFAAYRRDMEGDAEVAIEGADHFSILNVLAQEDGVLLQALLQHR